MLVDINLLPQKERKKSASFIYILLVLLLLVGSIGYGWLTYKQQVEVEKRLEEQLASTQKLREIHQQNINDSASSTAADQLEEALNWAENYPVSAYILLRHLASLLPERGFVLAFSYQDSGAVQLTAQFDSSREAAYFLNSLQSSKFVKKATLLSINTESLEESSGDEGLTDEANQEQEILPRYIAQYTLLINQDEIKKADEAGEGEL